MDKILLINFSIILIIFGHLCGALPSREIKSQDFKDSYLDKYKYVITAPKVWTSNEETVCLVLLKQIDLGNDQSLLKLLVQVISINTNVIFIEKRQELNSISECIQISISDIRAERVVIRVQLIPEGLSPLIDERFEIRVKPSDGLTLIETSKPIYRTNERLEFRIIRLNDWLRPIDDYFDVISVENSKSMVVMEWTDVISNNGIILLDMPIAEDNYYGIWKIRAINSKHMATEKIFKVYDYETPNVIISVDSPNYLNSNTKQSIIKVCVRNNFGQPIIGKIKVFAGYVKLDWERIQMLKHMTTPYDLKEFEIHGCYDFTLSLSKLEWNSSKYNRRDLKMSFQFIDENNGFIEEKVLEIPVVEQNLMITFPSVKLMKQYFKPNIPYFGHVMVVRPDYSPAENQRLTVCYESRETPWLSIESNYLCRQMISNSDGLLQFTIPPMNTQIKQIEVRVKSSEYPTIENRIFLEPSYSSSNEFMAIKPLINRNHCNESMVEFEVFSNQNLDEKQVYYQIIGQGINHWPQEYSLKKSHKNWKQSLISGSADKYDVYSAKISAEIPFQSALNNNLINRILVYYLDTNNDLIADSNIFLITCSDPSNQMTRISFDDRQNNNQIEVSLKTKQNSTCSLRITQNKPYNSLKRINQFIEKFNIRQESSASDKCHNIYKQRAAESESHLSPYSAPYDFESMSSTTYDPVVNYGDAWDSFNDIGLLVSSNIRLDESPCDWDLYPRDILSQLSEIRNTKMKYMSGIRAKKVLRNQIHDIERSLFNEVFDWSLVNTENNSRVDKQISRELASNSGQLFADSVCLNKESGITYARSLYDSKLSANDRHFRVTVLTPKQSRIGDTLVLKVFIEKITDFQTCIPIELDFENSDSYEVSADNPKMLCICGNGSQTVKMLLKPKSVGLINIKLIAKYPNDLTSVAISSDCSQTSKTIGFMSENLVKQMTVSPTGFVSKQIKQQIICSHNNKKNIYDNKIPELLDLSSLRNDSSNTLVTNDLFDPLFQYIKTKMSSRNHNALDSLSAFAATYYLYNYSEFTSTDWLNRNQLTEVLSKSFQSLQTYRHTDGSYSLFKSKRHNSDLGLTVSVFKLLAQSKPYLSFIENGHRINRLQQTLIWILEQQAIDGCFHIAHHQKNRLNVWPISFQDNYQLTGYVLASLLEAGFDLNSRALTKAYECLSQNSKSLMESIESKPLSAILYTYIQILNGNTLDLENWMESSLVLNNLDESDLYSGEELSYLGLSYYLSNDLKSAKTIAEKLLNSSNNIWETPISCYAIIKLWPLLKYKTSASVKVYSENNEILTKLMLNKTYSMHKLSDGQTVDIDSNGLDKGCIFVTNNKLKTLLANEATNFDIKIDGLNKGFVTCNRRRLRLCVKQLVGLSTIHPVVRMQMITGFDVDTNLIKKMIDTELVTKYKKVGLELMLFLHPFHNRQQSYCFTIPLIQREEVYENNKAFIKIYDYYNEDINDVIAYEIPLECQIDTNVISVQKN